MNESTGIRNVASSKTQSSIVLPSLISGAGPPRADLRFIEFFTVNIRNKYTGAAYGRAAGAFLRWCEGRGIGERGRIQPEHGRVHRTIAG